MAIDSIDDTQTVPTFGPKISSISIMKRCVLWDDINQNQQNGTYWVGKNHFRRWPDFRWWSVSRTVSLTDTNVDGEPIPNSGHTFVFSHQWTTTTCVVCINIVRKSTEKIWPLSNPIEDHCNHLSVKFHSLSHWVKSESSIQL